jgi:type I restriction enzyme S subunit
MTEEQNKNQLPKDWKWVKLGEAVQVLDNLRKPVNSSERQKRIAGKSENELFPYYGATGQVGWIDNFITEGEYILVGEDGAPFLDNYKEKAYKIKGRTWINNHAHILQEIQNVTINDFILHYLNSINYRQYVNGTTRLKLTKGSLVEILFPLPPKPTQQAIVSKIEELFSELDKGIENLHTAQQQLKTYRQSVLKWAFEGKLTNGLNCDLYDEPDVHDLSIAAEPETEYKVEGNHNNQTNQKNHSSDKGELPEGWKWVKTIEVIKIINNGYTPTKQYLSEGSGEIPFIKVYNLNFNGSLNFKKNPTFIPHAIHKKDLKRSICLPGDVLINIVGPPLGKVSIVSNQFPEWNINQAIVMFRPNENVLSKYISYFMQNSVTINWLENTSKATAGQWNVKVSTCREIPFPICSIEEQNKVIQAIESRLSVADKMEESINESLQQAEALRQSILKKAFEGKLI